MSKILIPISAFSLLAMVAVAHADTRDLAVAKQCFSCHAVTRQVGKAPAFNEIAFKYMGKANVQASLAEKIQYGGVGHWGYYPMPSTELKRPDVSEAEANELAAWVLAQH
jgi:cytochrome c551/c552